MMLRLQRERMDEGLVPSLDGYYRDYGLTPRAWPRGPRCRRAASRAR